MKWVRIQDTSSYVASRDMLSPEEDLSLCRRFYSAEGQRYPVLSVAIYGNPISMIMREPIRGIKICCASKNRKGDGWDEHSDLACMTWDLLNDVTDMLHEVSQKYGLPVITAEQSCAGEAEGNK